MTLLLLLLLVVGAAQWVLPLALLLKAWVVLDKEEAMAITATARIKGSFRLYLNSEVVEGRRNEVIMAIWIWGDSANECFHVHQEAVDRKK